VETVKGTAIANPRVIAGALLILTVAVYFITGMENEN